MAFGSGGNGRKEMSEINVIPLVDIILVLLIIFMVTAPMLQQGVDVNLPQAAAKAITVETERIVVTVDPTGRIFVGKQPVKLNELQKKLAAIFENRSEKEVYFRADKSVSYGLVVKVIAEIKNAGIEKLGMVTQPLEGN